MRVEVAILSLSTFSLCQSASFLREIKTQIHQVRPYHMLVRKSRRDLRQLVSWQLRGEWAGKTMCKCPGVPSSRDESVCAAGRQWQPAHWFHTGSSINRATQTRAGERYPVKPKLDMMLQTRWNSVSFKYWCSRTTGCTQASICNHPNHLHLRLGSDSKSNREIEFV